MGKTDFLILKLISIFYNVLHDILQKVLEVQYLIDFLHLTI